MRDSLRFCIEQQTALAVFPELAICGYPPRDLLDKPSFITDTQIALRHLLDLSEQIDIIVGFVYRDESKSGKNLYNAAAFLSGGKINTVARKMLLPTYDVFDEDRYFLSSPEVTVVRIKNKRFGITICEDLWFPIQSKYTVDPVGLIAAKGVDYLINISASPFEEGKLKTRLGLISDTAKRFNMPVLYVNQSGANDGIIFDGGAVVADENGAVCAMSPRFSQEPYFIDTENFPESVQQLLPDKNQDLQEALAMGVRDYTRKTGFSKVVLGLSGGIDSAITAAIAVKALGSENVIGVSMPSRFSSPGSIADAKELSESLGITMYTIPIEPMFEAYLAHLTPYFFNKEFNIAEENIQARIRGNILMALSNKHGWLVLTTGNKSELAVGYCTLYGDMCGGLAVIGDVFKTRVYELAKHINANGTVIPESTITKPPSAELRHNQTDQDTLPEYSLLDAILREYIEHQKGVEEIVKIGYDKETVLRIIQMVDRSEYKRRQAAIALKISVKAFGEGRRIPVVQNYVPLDHCKIADN
jgi:NAD+ synthase (glutamine-hydrolysing)